MKNRIVAAVLAVMVAGALTACSSGSKDCTGNNAGCEGNPGEDD